MRVGKTPPEPARERVSLAASKSRVQSKKRIAHSSNNQPIKERKWRGADSNRGGCARRRLELSIVRGYLGGPALASPSPSVARLAPVRAAASARATSFGGGSRAASLGAPCSLVGTGAAGSRQRALTA